MPHITLSKKVSEEFKIFTNVNSEMRESMLLWWSFFTSRNNNPNKKAKGSKLNANQKFLLGTNSKSICCCSTRSMPSLKNKKMIIKIVELDFSWPSFNSGLY